MRIALVTTPPEVFSGIGDYTRHLLPYLRRHAEVDLFVEAGGEGVRGADVFRSAADLDPSSYDQILYQLGNERRHAFMARMIRALGGTVVQHDWVLFDQSLAAFPALARGGMKGAALALREGGFEQLRVYLANWLDRRRDKCEPPRPIDASALPGTLLAGWHASEPGGRWTTDLAYWRVPGDDVRRVAVLMHAVPGRTMRLLQGETELATATCADGARHVRLEGAALARSQPLLTLATDRVRVTEDQRRHGDARRLATFVEALAWQDGTGEWHDVDITGVPATPVVPVSLSRDRFRLPLNRSVVRHADAFVVHSEWVRHRILTLRGDSAPIGVVVHGAERRWHTAPKRETRRLLGLPESWVDGFLVVSFGGVQQHKRIDKLLAALVKARAQRPDIRLVLAGNLVAEGFDARRHADALGLSDHVHFTGFVGEEVGWQWIHAGDVAVNLRGPTSGGSSGGIFQSFSLGRAVIASDAAEQRELPDSCTLKVPLGPEEVDAIARILVELRDDPARVERLGEAAREYVRRHCHWEHVAARYAQHLEAFPRPRAARRRARAGVPALPAPAGGG